MDDLEQIKARKMQDMMRRAAKQENTTHPPVLAELTDGNFNSVVASKPLVVVDCWAVWCYPCRMIAPIIEELASEYGSMATFAKLNVDENPSTAMKYDIQGIPTILVIKNGVEVDRIVGALPKGEIEAVLKKHI